MTPYPHARLYRCLNRELARLSTWMECTPVDPSAPAYCRARATTWRLHDIIHRLERRFEAIRLGDRWARTSTHSSH